jgi:hypothetical protein
MRSRQTAFTEADVATNPDDSQQKKAIQRLVIIGTRLLWGSKLKWTNTAYMNRHN